MIKWLIKRFKRQEYARYKKLGIKWRRPRGKTSKMRRYEAGKPDMPAIGYRTPRAVGIYILQVIMMFLFII